MYSVHMYLNANKHTLKGTLCSFILAKMKTKCIRIFAVACLEGENSRDLNSFLSPFFYLLLIFLKKFEIQIRPTSSGWKLICAELHKYLVRNSFY